MKTTWLSKEVLSWQVEAGVQTGFDDPEFNRAYEHLTHANGLLRLAEDDDMYLVDVISTLKRCLNQRLRLLNHLYDFSSAPIQNRPKRLLDQLAEFDLVRPFFLEYLLEIRNAVEHEDTHPPSRERCAELADVMWYFLRSTDSLTRSWTSSFILSPKKPSSLSPSWIEVEVLEIGSWQFVLHGLIPHGLLSPEEVRGWVQLELLDALSYVRLAPEMSVHRVPDSVLRVPDNVAERKEEASGLRRFYAKLSGPLAAREAISRLWVLTL